MSSNSSRSSSSRSGFLRAAFAVLFAVATAFVVSRHVFEQIDPNIQNQSIFDFEVKGLNSEEAIPLSSLKGKKAYLVVNVASQCGLTLRNYDELNQLYDKYRKDGLEILAFPCNNFKNQESMCEADISSFVRETKHSEFPVFGKLECENKESTHPLFVYLKHRSPMGWLDVLLGRKLKWNFHKFLCNADGIPVKRYLPIEYPLSFEKDVKDILNAKQNN